MINVLILSGNGINCEIESANAFKRENTKVTIAHVNELIDKKIRLKDYSILVLPGGFSYGDEISSGKILALKLKKFLMSDIHEFISQSKYIVGICNGFQILSHLDLFDIPISLVDNIEDRFINKWVELEVNQSLFWTKSISKEISMPIRHAQGRVYCEDEVPKEQILFKYKHNLNGSSQSIAGVTNKKGNILGLMPHPEAALHQSAYEDRDENQKFFNNIINKAQETI